MSGIVRVSTHGTVGAAAQKQVESLEDVCDMSILSMICANIYRVILNTL